MGTADGGASSGSRCETVLLQAEAVVLLKCRDDSTYALRWIDGPEIAHAGVRAVIDGQVYRAQDWPISAWQTGARRAQLTLSGNAVLPQVELSVAVRDSIVEITVALSSPHATQIEHFDLLWSGGPIGGLSLAGGPPRTWLSFGDAGSPLGPSASATERQTEQAFFNGSSALLVTMNSPRGFIEVHPDAAQDRLGLTVQDRGPLRIGDDEPYVVQVQLRAGPDLPTLLAASTLGRDGRDVGQHAPVVGWRSGAAHGYDIHRYLVDSASAWLRESTTEGVIMIDGLWYEGLGQWSLGPAFSMGSLASDEAAVGLRWPGLRVPVDEIETAPDRVLSRMCSDGPCALLNAGRPDVREAFAREAIALRRLGVSLVDLPDIPVSWYAALIEVCAASGLRPVLGPGGRPKGEYILRLTPTELAGRPPCAGPSAINTAACREHVSSGALSGRTEPIDLSRLHRQAWAMATHWHHGLTLSIDPGPVHVAGQSPGVARQWAAMVALAGGLYFLGDTLSEVTAEMNAIFWAPWSAGLVAPARPVYDGAELPSVWISGRSVTLFNWTDETRTVSDLAEYLTEQAIVYSLFDGREFRGGVPASLEIPPHDVAVLFTQE